MRILCLLALWLLSGASAHADVFRPAYLELREQADRTYDVLWKVPAQGEMRLALYVRMPDGVETIVQPRTRMAAGSYEERWRIRHAAGLEGKAIAIDGLSGSNADVLVRVIRAGGSEQVERLLPAKTSFTLTAPAGRGEVARTYLVLGVHHILAGFDHLLFVLALLLIVGNGMRIVATITAFTVAHSITLAVATLGYAHIPAPPLNAAIALSILFLGPEIVRVWRGETSFTIRHPWIVAFAFGLLHGFGFASGLTALGLPEGDIPLALFAFNVGVEIGQLAFVALILLTVRAFKVLELHWSKAMQLAPGYVVGTFGAFWTIQRVVMMIEGG